MTTQVVLMNGLGVALASDSAVTAGGKVLNTSEKVFELPSPHKVGILSSGRALFMGHPWEVLLSAWSDTLLSPLASMNDYRESLYKFLRTTVSSTGDLNGFEKTYLGESYWTDGGVFYKTKEILEAVVLPYFENILSPEEFLIFMDSQWSEEVKTRMSAYVSPELISKIESAFEEAIEERKSTFQEAEEVSYAQAMIWVERYWEHVGKGPSETDFEAWPKIGVLDSLIKKMASVHIVNADYQGESDMVFVGYGSQDLFPSISEVFFHGCIAGKLIKRFEGDNPSSPEPRDYFFGQSEAISALTRGEDSFLTSTAVETSRKTLNDIFEKLAASDDENVQMTREYVRESLDKDDLAAEMKRAGNERRRKPFIKAISMSPILDLAEFAAQLVGVQAASAAMTQENPSVGGFVDVAVISHRRGFEWIRHKPHG